MKPGVLVVLIAAVLQAISAHGQSLTAEADVTAGYSTDEVGAAATQHRAFGDLPVYRQTPVDLALTYSVKLR